MKQSKKKNRMKLNKSQPSTLPQGLVLYSENPRLIKKIYNTNYNYNCLSLELQTAMRQNRKMNKTLQDKQCIPLTASQEVWLLLLFIIEICVLHFLASHKEEFVFCAISQYLCISFLLKENSYLYILFFSNFLWNYIKLGWEKQDLTPPVAGRAGSDITKFAAELVKNGIYYWLSKFNTIIFKIII